MSVSIDIVDLLGQVSVAIPIVAPFQPIFGALKLILQQAQKLSDDQRCLATLAVRSARLSLSLHDQMVKHADQLDDQVKARVDEINGIIDSILSEFKKVNERPSWRRFPKARSILSKVSDLCDDMKTCIDNCHLALGINTAAKLTHSSNVIDRTHERVCKIESRVAQYQSGRFHIDPKSDLAIVHRSELRLTKLIDTHQMIRVATGDKVTVTTHDALWNETTPVRIKCFRSVVPFSAKDAFELELSRCKDIWDSFLCQPRGHSARERTPSYIIYHLPIASTQAPFVHLLDQCIASDFGMTLRLLFAVQDLIRRWGDIVSVYPFTEYDNAADQRFKCEIWVDNVAFDSKMLDCSLECLSPIFQGDLCIMKSNGTLRASDSFMSWLASWLRRRYRDLPVLDAMYNATMVRWCEPKLMASYGSLPMSAECLDRAFQEAGWLSVDSTPSLLLDDGKICLNNYWEWIRGSELTAFRHTFRDAELGCDKWEVVFWWPEFDMGEHRVYCYCNEKKHRDFSRRIDLLHIYWQGTPLDSLEFRSRDYVEGRQYEWKILNSPSLSADADNYSEFRNSREDEAEGSGTDDESHEVYYSADEGDS